MKPTVYTSRPRDSYPARLLRAFLSAIIPGLGQLMAGVRRRGIILLAIFAVVTAAGIFIFSRGTDALVDLALQPRVLLVLLLADIAIMLVRLFAVIDAWLTAKAGSLKLARPSGGRTALTGVGLVLILAFTIAPHAVAGYYTIVSHNLLTTVFTPANTTTTQKSTASSGSSTSGTSVTNGTSVTSGTSVNPGSVSSDSTSSTGSGTTLNWGSDGRMTVLLIGTDAGFGRTGARADSMNVASIDIKTGRVAIFGQPGVGLQRGDAQGAGDDLGQARIAGAQALVNADDILVVDRKNDGGAGAVNVLVVVIFQVGDAAAVKKGSWIWLKAQEDSLLVRTKGQALEDGDLGQEIKVRTDNKKVLKGKIVSATEVEVSY